jgi:predicted AAA+ superfamily ATPase
MILGPRRTGKSTFLKNQVRWDEYIDLLKSDVFYEYAVRPALLRERYGRKSSLIVIDEIQRVPDLLSEIHWLLENSKLKFILCGSSARSLRKRGVTNLAGRLKTARFAPLTWEELEPSPEADLNRVLQYGTIAPIYFSADPWDDLRDYCGEYLKEEIQSEGLARSIPGFNRFLESAALGNAELVSFAAIARDCGVGPKTAAEYFQILEDTLIGLFLEPWRKSKKRRPILSRKFYFFDCGVANFLLRRRISPKTPEYGKSFEQFLVLETFAARWYEKKIETLHFWRSASGYEVDLLIDDHTAVEFKSGTVHPGDAAGLLALSEEIKLKNLWIVSTEPVPRRLPKGIEVLPWREYLHRVKALA